MSEQEEFFRHMGAVLANLAAATENVRTLQQIALARGYDQWQDADLTAIGKERNDLLAVLYFAGDLDAFLNNGVPPQTFRWPTINKYRTDL